MAIFCLSHTTARARAVEAVRQAPEGYIVKVQEPTRSLEQNAKIHAAITDYGRAIDWNFGGQRVDLEDLKSILMAAFRKQQGHPARFVLGFDGQPVPLSWRTRDLKKKDAGEFIEMVEYLIATKGDKVKNDWFVAYEYDRRGQILVNAEKTKFKAFLHGEMGQERESHEAAFGDLLKMNEANNGQ